MTFTVKAVEPAAFEDWLRQTASVDRTSDADGLSLFLRHGCGACHSIAGTQADGKIGPDLTVVGARETIAAGTLPNTIEGIARFIRNPNEVKPGVHMPAYGMLPDGDVEVIAAYLKGLQ
jgi:cytochrome c oxidase subunit 2